MFTVIFAEKETIKLFEETKMFFGPLYDSEKVAFCEWDKDAEDFDTMVPELYDLIEYQSEWRALILYDDGYEKLNPFDYTEYSEAFFSKKDNSWDYYNERRKNRIAAYEKSYSNPLVKLSTALSGIPVFKSAISEKDFSALMTGEMQTYEYMLKEQLGAINCSEIAVRLDKFQREALRRFVAEENVELLISYIKTADVSGITGLIPDTEILDFIKYIGNDPIYYDPEYTECLIENTKKFDLLKAVADCFSMKDKLPSEIVCFSPRTFDFEKVEQDIKWKKKDENSSSRFANYNLYNEKLKFILFDILPKDNKQYKFEHIKLLCLLLIIANNEMPQGLLNSANVYRAEIDFNDNIVTKICENYISKLKSTQLLLKDIEIQLDSDTEKSVDDRTAQRLFESDINIPVEIVTENNESELYAEYKKLGLSTDCPQDERAYWSNQYRNISKRFVRYLREPRRAVKSAVTEGLRKNNFINDDRTLILSENQIEDVKLHLAESEQRMVETVTNHLYDTKKFTEQIQKADEEVRQSISQRMTKKKTVIVGLVAGLAYLIGFLPLLFGNLNTSKSILVSLTLTGIFLGVFLVIGFIYLFVLRGILVNSFRHFNHVISGICSQINGVMSQFSHYISYVCNVMRDYSVLKNRDSAVTRTKKILSYHDMKISEQIKNVHEMFSKYVDFNKLHIRECEPYDFDFTVLRNYDYEMPSIHSKKRIKYLQQGNEVTVPIDYVESVTLTREELYD
ncbi:MAG: hypothetical protein SPJ42_07085 [Oscillospiraceae bacterium]|nr:hypothetical protein [Oscillospiraceae bacterium]